jgi:hypothetical protein
MDWAAMPEAAINEDCDSDDWEDNVGPASNGGIGSAILEEAESFGVEGGAQRSLRRRL